MATRFIGGESAHRSFWGGRSSKSQTRALLVCAGVTVVWMMFGGGAIALTAGVLASLVVIVGNLSTHRGSVLERREKRSRWRRRRKAGWDRFVPYTPETWAAAQAEAAAANGKRTAARVLAAVRSRPDGADGMGWLDSRTGHPGVAWHSPEGEQAYLSVAFELDGQLRGAESQRVQNSAQAGFGSLLASCAPADSLVRGVQSLTRVLPPDLALNERWVQEHMAADAPDEAVASYQEVLARTGKGTFVQKHIAVGRWPLTEEFKSKAALYGPGRDGWRALMEQEIAKIAASYRAARYGRVKPLTARAVVAMILHQQNPSRPPLMVADVDPRHMGVPSWDEWNGHWCQGVDPITGTDAVWGHRTARISADNVETGERTPYWLLSLLLAGGDGARTLSFQIEVVPAPSARQLAAKDVVRDTASAMAKARKGQLVDAETDVALRAAKARAADLEPGTGVHGSNWVGYITVSAQTQRELTNAAARLEQTASTSAGIQKLEWLDTFQSSASGTTWPIFRGLAPATPTMGARLLGRLAGKADKEEKVA
ncbi:SCO6880 family protein [Sinomonas sp. JGH33]|uniref:SCO6880 family protein n=1 Tax=Sinomonas terricola TaxID=3110330 RepID=A0ABU5TB99_9MICC|nr:SCO6880 family protein [Sinomonas sp. JGH33]MEA5456958.1 SCO6880 family protein [Sinomonas sp. JGH33]